MRSASTEPDGVNRSTVTVLASPAADSVMMSARSGGRRMLVAGRLLQGHNVNTWWLLTRHGWPMARPQTHITLLLRSMVCSRLSSGSFDNVSENITTMPLTDWASIASGWPGHQTVNLSYISIFFLVVIHAWHPCFPLNGIMKYLTWPDLTTTRCKGFSA